MGKKSGGSASMPSPQEYIPLVNAQAAANRVNTYTPYGSTVFSPAGGGSSGGRRRTTDVRPGGASRGGKMGRIQQSGQQQSRDPSRSVMPMQSVTTFSPEVQRLFEQQVSMAGGPANSQTFNQDIEQATFRRAMNLLEPGQQQQMRDFQQTMADRGLPSGGAAYDNEFANISRAQNQAREQAALSAVLAGNDVAARERGLNMSERGQQFNELASILGQNQVVPTSPVDVMGPANMALNRNVANMQNQQAKKSSGVNAGTNLGAAYLMGSDRRLKENIVRLGEMSNGLNIYAFNYKDNPERTIGVMADEVELIMPEAVYTRFDGYKMVNYGKVLNG